MTSSSRRFIIGDIHGCVHELELLLNKFQFSPSQDTLYSVGDVVGKGPFPLESLELLKKMRAKIVLGNHETVVLRGASKSAHERTHWEVQYLSSLGTQVNDWVQEMKSWPYYIEEEDLIVVHAGLEPNVSKLEDMDPNILTRIRLWKDPQNQIESPWFENTQVTKKVIFGHWAQKGLVNLPQYKGLDTGCVYGNCLTGYCPEEDTFYQTPSLKSYCPIIEK